MQAEEDVRAIAFGSMGTGDAYPRSSKHEGEPWRELAEFISGLIIYSSVASAKKNKEGMPRENAS